MVRVRTGVFGGTFDPPHVGHLILAQHALEQLKLERVLFIPAGDPWRKRAREVTPAFHRLAMTRLATVDNSAFVVDDCEVTREGATSRYCDRSPARKSSTLPIGWRCAMATSGTSSATVT